MLRLVLRLEICLLQVQGLCPDSDIIFWSTLLRLGLGNKSEERPLLTSDKGICRTAPATPGLLNIAFIQTMLQSSA